MTKYKDRPSLLPYLEDNSQGIRICIALEERFTASADRLDSPFRHIPCSNPLFVTYQGKIIFDSGDLIDNIFIVKSRDNYVFQNIEPNEISNSAVDQFWDQSYAFYRSLSDSPLICLGSQMGTEKIFSRLASLFYCKRQKRYFHPPCPMCGTQLDLALDDKILEDSGLSPYTSSLDRYLFCPKCLENGLIKFYVLDLGVRDRRNQLVNDAKGLIASWKNIVDNKLFVSGLPCIDCPENRRCFNEKIRAADSIVPFSFYPFYMFIFKAPDMQASEFLSVVSGGKDKTLGKGPAGYSFFDERGSHFFMEVLFLKLSLLQHILKDFLSGDYSFRNDLPLLLENIWIRMPKLPGLLPRFWAFVPVFIGLVSDIREIARPRPFPNHLLFQCAVFWFQVLCSGRRQDISLITNGVEKMVAVLSEHPDISWRDMKGQAGQVFSLEAFFGRKPEFEISHGHKKVWDHVMALGFDMLRASMNHVIAEDVDKFLDRMDDAAETLKNAMFQEGAGDLQEKMETGTGKGILTKETGEDDLRIYNILGHILEKYEGQPTAEPSSLSKRKEPRVEKERERIGISDSMEETLPLNVEEGDGLPETVILSRRDEPSRYGSPGTMNASHIPERPPDIHMPWEAGKKKRDDEEDDDGFLEETVILKPPEKDK